MGVIVGLDVGIASLGLSVIDPSYNVLESVSYIFPAAEAAGNADRRNFRQIRRLHRRKKTRISDFGKLWVKSGFSVPTEECNTPLQLRVKGLNEEISMNDLYFVLANNLRHRGISYLEDALDDSIADSSSYAKGLEQNRRELKDKLPCEIQLERLEKYGKYRGVVSIFDDTDINAYLNVFTVSGYRKELNRIFATQKKYHPEISDEFVSEFMKIFERKRKYYEGPGNEKSRTDYGKYTTRIGVDGNYITEENIFEKLIGKCSVYKTENRAAAASFTAQEFNVLSDLNNLVVNGRKLEQFEKEELVKIIKSSSSVNMRKIISSVTGESIVSLEGARIDKNEKEIYHTFEVYRKMAKYLFSLGIDINNFSREELDEIGHILTINTDKESIVEAFSKSCMKLKNDIVEALCEFRKRNSSDFSKWHSFSLKIMNELIPEMYVQSKNQMQLLTDMGVFRQSSDLFQGKKYIPDDAIVEDIFNPVVKRSIKIAVMAVNAVIKKYGDIDMVVVEMPRDDNTEDQQSRIKEEQKRNENEWPTIEKKLKSEYGITLSSSDFRNNKELKLKLKLWNEQGGRCLYSGKSINVIDLIKEPNRFEIDHAIPYSISFDNARTNKVLVYSSENQLKGNETPFMYLNRITHLDWSFDSYKEYVLSMPIPRTQKDKLTFSQDITKIEVLEGFINRNLNDTRYASRVVLNTMQKFFKANGKNTRVKVLKGAATSLMRSNLKLDKNRDESYSHHAVDAMLIAYSQMGYDAYHKLQGEVIDFETGEILDKSRLSEVINDKTCKKLLYEDKMFEIRTNIKIAESNTKYWYMVDKKPNRSLANQTIYGTRNIEGETKHIAKIKDIYSKEGFAQLKKRLNTPECFLMYRNDPQTWNDLVLICEKYKDAPNPFVAYEKETGDYLRKYSKHHNGPRVVSLKYITGNVGNCIDISHKYGFEKGSKRVILDTLTPFRTDVYFDTIHNSYALVGIKMSDLTVRGGKTFIDFEKYDMTLRKEGLISDSQTYKNLKDNGYEFRLSFFRNDLIEYTKNDEIQLVRFWSKNDSSKNRIEIKPIDAPKYEKQTMQVLSKANSIRKVRSDELGNRFFCSKEPFCSEIN